MDHAVTQTSVINKQGCDVAHYRSMYIDSTTAVRVRLKFPLRTLVITINVKTSYLLLGLGLSQNILLLHGGLDKCQE